MSEGEKLAKRIYSLAYHRATARVVREHQEEFQRWLEVYKSNIRAEYELTGSIDSARNPRKHVEADLGGVCEFDGQEWPCKQEKAQRRAERARSATSSTTSSSDERHSQLKVES